jgi:NlpC/P60 family putative phage cell wall peptidase
MPEVSTMAARCSGADIGLRLAAVAEARCWLGTPYCHQGSVKGAGADCLGLLRGVWRTILGDEPELPPPYSSDWSEASGDERLMAAALRHLRQIDPGHAGIGDVLLFRMRPSATAKHLGLLVSNQVDQGRIIHAYSGHGVCETHLTESWRRKLAAFFRFPERGY